MWGVWGVWGVRGVRGVRLLPHPPTPPTPLGFLTSEKSRMGETPRRSRTRYRAAFRREDRAGSP